MTRADKDPQICAFFHHYVSLFFLSCSASPTAINLSQKPKTWHAIAWNINKPIRYLLIFLPLGTGMAWLLLMWKILWVNIVLLLKATGDFKKFDSGWEKWPVYNSNFKKMSGLVQGHLLGINVIGESGSNAGIMCFREKCSPGQLPAWTASAHHPNMLRWRQWLVPVCWSEALKCVLTNSL